MVAGFSILPDLQRLKKEEKYDNKWVWMSILQLDASVDTRKWDWLHWRVCEMIQTAKSPFYKLQNPKPHHQPHHAATRQMVPLEPFQLKAKVIRLFLQYISQVMPYLTYELVLDQWSSHLNLSICGEIIQNS